MDLRIDFHVGNRGSTQATTTFTQEDDGSSAGPRLSGLRTLCAWDAPPDPLPVASAATRQGKATLTRVLKPRPRPPGAGDTAKERASTGEDPGEGARGDGVPPGVAPQRGAEDLQLAQPCARSTASAVGVRGHRG